MTVNIPHGTFDIRALAPAAVRSQRSQGSGRELEVQTRLAAAPERRRLLDVLLFNCTTHTQTYFTLITTRLTNHHSSSNKSPQEHSDAAHIMDHNNRTLPSKMCFTR